jgi:hypothetical protein
MWIALLAGLASAQGVGGGQLVVSVDGFIQLIVDGQWAQMDSGRYNVPVGAGRHEVVLKKPKGEIYRGFVEVPAGHEVRCRWNEGRFGCYESVLVATGAAAAAPVVVAGPGYTEVTTTTVTTTTGAPTVQMTVGAPVVAVGMGMPMGGVVINDGASNVTVTAGFGIPVGTVQVGTTSSTTTYTTTTTTGPVAPAIVAPSQVKMIVRSTDGEWADVLVDGKVVAEIRNTPEITVWVTPGMHSIEVKEFMADRAYSRARIDTGAAGVFTIGLTENAPMVCYDHPGFSAQ